MPGTDAGEATRLVFDVLAEFPHLPELPARGPGADLLGRSAVLLAELHVDRQPAGWRLVSRPGVEERRARDLLHRDLDILEEVAAGYAGPLKLQAAGPWTLAAGLQLTRGDRVLRDQGAVRDVGDALAEGLRDHVSDVARRVPGARLVVQLDEPSLPAVLAGHLPTASGFGSLPPVEDQPARDRLAVVVDAVRVAGGVPVVHCCAEHPPVGLLRASGAEAVGVDVTKLGDADLDPLSEAVEAGGRLLLGVVPAVAPAVDPAAEPSVRDLVGQMLALWVRLGFSVGALPDTVVVTPSCGLAGASPAWARQALALAGEVASAADEEASG